MAKIHIGISLDETTTKNDIEKIIQIINGDKTPVFNIANIVSGSASDIEDSASSNSLFVLPSIFNHFRTSKFLQHSVFNRYHSETEMLRYIKRLESRDLSLTASMIPLGSCTMKLNAAAEMFPVSWPEFAKIHPFAPVKQTRGYQILFQQLEDWLAEITGFAGISLAAQRRFAGRIRRTARHPRLSRIARRHASQRLFDSDFRARHESGERGHGRNESRRRRVRHERQH